MEYYSQEKEKVLQTLNTNVDGLAEAEAQKRLAEHGKNKLIEAKKTSMWKRLILQLTDPMIIVLLVAALLSGITSAYSGESFADVFIILFVVVLNSVLGVVQESKAEDAIEALKNMTAATTKVLRDGKVTYVKSEDLVAGDIILLEAGDAVPADARIIESASMQVEEAALTGESVPVTKTTDALVADTEISLGDRKNMLYMGSIVVYGRGQAVVCATGMQTEMGKIADALTQAKDEKTPLQLKLASLSKVLTWLVLAICVIIFVAGVLEAGRITIEVLLSTFMLSVSPCGCRHSGRACCCCYYCVVYWRYKNVEAQCYYSSSHCCGNSRLRPDHLFR